MNNSFKLFCETGSSKCPYEVGSFKNFDSANILKKGYESEPLAYALDSRYFILEFKSKGDYSDNPHNSNGKVISVQVNGVLCEKVEQLNIDTKADKELIDVLNRLYRKGYHIILRHKTEPILEDWLDKNGVLYNGIVYDDFQAEIYINSNHITYNRLKTINKLKYDVLRPKEIYDLRQKYTQN